MSEAPTSSSSQERDVFGLRFRLRLVTSHNIARPGFESKREAFFVESGASHDAPPGDLEFIRLTVLDVELAKFRMEAPSNDARQVVVDFERRMTEVDALEFMQRLADAWSASLAPDQKDPWYGNLHVEVLGSSVKTITAQSGGPESHLQLTSQQSIETGRNTLEDLRWSPLTDIFVEGMRSPQPRSKFLFWFVVLEELEQRVEFRTLFTPLFPEAVKIAVRQAVGGNISATTRLDGLLNNPAATIEGRATKLQRILERIGVTQVDALGKVILVDVALCRRLIDQRNHVAHKGERIDQNLLYAVLFPLSQLALAYMLTCDT